MAIELVFILICFGMGKYQAFRFDKEQKKIKHWLWFLYYSLLIIPAWVATHNVWLILACGLMHLPIFNTFLNYFRTPRRPVLYINKDGDSWLDRLWYKFYPAVFFGSFAAIVALQYLTFR